MNKRLSDFFSPEEVKRDGCFADVGHADSAVPGTLVYCDSVHYLEIANLNNNVSCVLTTPELASQAVTGKGVVAIASPRNAFFACTSVLVPSRRQMKRRFTPRLSFHRERGSGVA